MPKKIPMRTCIGCGQVKEKRTLVRLVKTQDDKIVTDVRARAKGRGAYLCRDPECLEKARRKKAFSRSFGMGLTDENYQELLEEMKVLLAGEDTV